MKNLYLILMLSIGLFLFVIMPKSVDDTNLEKRLEFGISIKNRMIEKGQKQAKYYIEAYPDYIESYKNGLIRDSLFFVYQNEGSDESRGNYLLEFKSKNEYEYDFRKLDFSFDELQFLKNNSKYRTLLNTILNNKMNDFRCISWNFPMMEILGSSIFFGRYEPAINQTQAVYQGDEINIPIYLILREIEEELQLTKVWLNGKLLANNQIQIKATEIGKQQFEIEMESDNFRKRSQIFEFIVK